MSQRYRVELLVLFLIAVTGVMWGQGAVGTLNGTVLDSAGAVVPSAQVTIINTETGVENKTTTTSAGAYTLPYLPQGTYTIRVVAAGFRTATAENVILRAAQTLTVNINLEVGQVNEQVTVSATPPLLEAGTAEIGQYINQNEFKTWPIFTSDGQRQIQQFMFDSLPGTTGGTWEGSINGGQTFSHEIMIEGIPLGRADISGGNNNEMSPSIDSIGDFKMQTGAVGAQYNGGQTAIANFSIKSGTNELHGSGFLYLQNEAFNAAGLNETTSAAKKGKNRNTNWGGSLGGPVFIPKIYDGRNKTFFFVNFEKDNLNQLGIGNVTTTLAPTAFRDGDFSQLLNGSWNGTGSPIQIYDPASTRIVNGQTVRDPFAGNIIPTDRLNSAAVNVLNSGYTEPTLPSLFNNTASLTNVPFFREHIIGLKIDHNITDTEHFSAYYNHGLRDRNNNGGSTYLPIPGYMTSTWREQQTPSRMARASLTSTLSPTLVNRISAGFNRFFNANGAPAEQVGKDWAGQLGINGVSDTLFPAFRFDGSNYLGGSVADMGVGWAGASSNGSWVFNDDLTKITGKHTIHIGYQYTRYYYNERNLSDSGIFNFSNIETALPGQTTTSGNAFASFMLGAVHSASHSIVDLSSGFVAPFHALWIGDDFKITPKLTLTTGLRWEIITPFYERTGRMSYIDLDASNPTAGGRNGAIVFANRPTDTYWRQVLPRLGIAYQLNDKTVIRTGYAILSTPPTTNGWGYAGFTSGYNAGVTVAANSSPTGFADDPAMYLTDTFPQLGYTLPDQSQEAANFNAGRAIAPDSNRPAYVQNWNFGVQRELNKSTVLEVSYVGNKGTRVWGFNSYNSLPSTYLSMGNLLNESISAHSSLMPYASFPTSATVAQALRPYPQYYGVTDQYAYNASSNYHSLQATATRHLTSDLGFIAAYTWSKTIDYQDSQGATAYGTPQDYYNTSLERSVASFDRTHVFKFTWSYGLPFGKGKRWDLKWANPVLGGWNLSGIHLYESGRPVKVDSGGLNMPSGFGSIRPDVTGEPYTVSADLDSVDNQEGTQWLNPAAFRAVPTTDDGVPLRVGTAPRTISQLRYPHDMSEKFRMSKSFPIYGDRFQLKLGAVADNPFKRTSVYLVSSTVNSVMDSDFGKVKRTGAGRTIQFDMRLEF